MKDSPAACATLGLDLTRTKVGVFALSAAMAGLGGALFGGLRGSIGPNDFVYQQSLVILLMATIGGITTVSGAFIGGMALAVFPVIQSHITSIQNLTFLGAGLGAMTIARSPNGIVSQVSGVFERLRRRTTAAASRGVEVPGEVERVVAPVG